MLTPKAQLYNIDLCTCYPL